MNLSMSKLELKEYIAKQLDNLFPDKYKFCGRDVDEAIDIALERTEFCFKHIALPHYTRENNVWFDHLHSDQYSTFLYFLSNSLWQLSKNKPLCDKLVLLNKSLNGLFVSYKCKMPKIFLFSHPIGTIIGNAIYSDYIVFLQNVTINSKNLEDSIPLIGKGVVLSAGCCIIGETKVGNRSSIGCNVVAHNMNIPQDAIVFSDSNGCINIKQSKKDCFAQFFFNVRITD